MGCKILSQNPLVLLKSRSRIHRFPAYSLLIPGIFQQGFLENQGILGKLRTCYNPTYKLTKLLTFLTSTGHHSQLREVTLTQCFCTDIEVLQEHVLSTTVTDPCFHHTSIDPSTHPSSFSEPVYSAISL